MKKTLLSLLPPVKFRLWLLAFTSAFSLQPSAFSFTLPDTIDRSVLYFAPSNAPYSNYVWLGSAYTNFQNGGWLRTNSSTLRWEYLTNQTLIATNTTATNVWRSTNGSVNAFTSYWASASSGSPGAPTVGTNSGSGTSTNVAPVVAGVPYALTATTATNLSSTFVTNIYQWPNYRQIYVSGTSHGNINTVFNFRDAKFVDNSANPCVNWTNSTGQMVVLMGSSTYANLYTGGFILCSTNPDYAAGTDLYYVEGGDVDSTGAFQLLGLWSGGSSSGSVEVYGTPEPKMAYGTNTVTNIVAVTAYTITNSDITVDPIWGNDATASVGGLPFKSIYLANQLSQSGAFRWHFHLGTNDCFLPMQMTNWTADCDQGAAFETRNNWEGTPIVLCGSFLMNGGKFLQTPIGGGFGAPMLTSSGTSSGRTFTFNGVNAITDWGFSQFFEAADYLQFFYNNCNFACGSWPIEIHATQTGRAYVTDCTIQANAWRAGGLGNNYCIEFMNTESYVTGCTLLISNSIPNNGGLNPVGISVVGAASLHIAGTTYDDSRSTWKTNKSYAIWNHHNGTGTSNGPVIMFSPLYQTNRLLGTNFHISMWPTNVDF